MRPQTAFRPKTQTAAVLRSLAGPDIVVEARVSASEGKLVTFCSPAAFTVNSAVRADLDGALLLGEITRSAPGENGFEVTLQVEQAIPSLSDLAKLVQSLFGEGFTKTATPLSVEAAAVGQTR